MSASLSNNSKNSSTIKSSNNQNQSNNLTRSIKD
jgi:hypothetical protein